MKFDELKKLVRVKKICKGIYHFKFPNQCDLARTMLRFQEYYESPEFKGKIFTLKEFKKWYSTCRLKPSTKEGFTYFSDWGGFNFPDYVVDAIREFPNLTQREKLVLHYCDFIKEEKYYIIATSDDKDHDALDHEIAHALYYINDNYRSAIDRLLTNAPKELHLVVQYLHTIGYDRDVFADECQAWLCHDSDFLKEEGVNLNGLHTLITDLQHQFRKTISALTERDTVEPL